MLTSSFVAKSEDDDDTEDPESHVPVPPEDL
jgi:hypothetical protein